MGQVGRTSPPPFLSSAAAHSLCGHVRACCYLLRCLWQHYVNYNVAIVAALCCCSCYLAGFVCASILLGFFIWRRSTTMLQTSLSAVAKRLRRTSKVAQQHADKTMTECERREEGERHACCLQLQPKKKNTDKFTFNSLSLTILRSFTHTLYW